jgi:hypothetical protein
MIKSDLVSERQGLRAKRQSNAKGYVDTFRYNVFCTVELVGEHGEDQLKITDNVPSRGV